MSGTSPEPKGKSINIGLRSYNDFFYSCMGNPRRPFSTGEMLALFNRTQVECGLREQINSRYDRLKGKSKKTIATTMQQQSTFFKHKRNEEARFSIIANRQAAINKPRRLSIRRQISGLVISLKFLSIT